MTATVEALRVAVRCRPLNQREISQNEAKIVNIDSKASSISITDPSNNNPTQFTFDFAYDETCKQKDVYEKTASPLVDNVLHGFNATIFAYGQTGTGKSFSMEGIRSDPELCGIIPNSFHHIFNYAEKVKDSIQVLVRCSYLEIYNEEVRDLLAESLVKLEIRESPEKGIFVKDLKEFVVKSADEMNKLMDQGTKNRAVGETAMNATSSRSHSIFTIIVETCDKKDGFIKAGKLNLVDLAGSERQSKTLATGQRLKEATKINLSLTALGNVITALVDGTNHVPYRDSKLTRLLQDSLGGNSKTLMMATMSPAAYNFEETLSTLRYANRAKNIKNKPIVNEDPRDSLLRQYRDEVKRLRMQLVVSRWSNAKGLVITGKTNKVSPENDNIDYDLLPQIVQKMNNSVDKEPLPAQPEITLSEKATAAVSLQNTMSEKATLVAANAIPDQKPLMPSRSKSASIMTAKPENQVVIPLGKAVEIHQELRDINLATFLETRNVQIFDQTKPLEIVDPKNLPNFQINEDKDKDLEKQQITALKKYNLAKWIASIILICCWSIFMFSSGFGFGFGMLPSRPEPKAKLWLDWAAERNFNEPKDIEAICVLPQK